MYPEFVLPALLCIAGLILLADFSPIDVDWSPDQNPDYEEDFAIKDDARKANQTNKGAATASTT